MASTQDKNGGRPKGLIITRVVPIKGGVIVQSRIHQDDIAGFINGLDQLYEYHNLPMKYDGDA